jgi:hypothetical protein
MIATRTDSLSGLSHGTASATIFEAWSCRRSSLGWSATPPLCGGTGARWRSKTVSMPEKSPHSSFVPLRVFANAVAFTPAWRSNSASCSPVLHEKTHAFLALPAPTNIVSSSETETLITVSPSVAVTFVEASIGP